jgi:hypothetical protein
MAMDTIAKARAIPDELRSSRREQNVFAPARFALVPKFLIDVLTRPASRRPRLCGVHPTEIGPKEAERRMIGSDSHARQQTLAMLDTTTGEVVKATLKHEGNNVREFYSNLPWPVRVGIEATGSTQWSVSLLRRTRNRMSGGSSGRDSSGRATKKQKHDRRDADLLLSLLVEERFPAICTYERTARPADFIAAPTPVGMPAGQNTKCAAGHCLVARLPTSGAYQRMTANIGGIAG